MEHGTCMFNMLSLSQQWLQISQARILRIVQLCQLEPPSKRKTSREVMPFELVRGHVCMWVQNFEGSLGWILIACLCGKKYHRDQLLDWREIAEWKCTLSHHLIMTFQWLVAFVDNVDNRSAQGYICAWRANLGVFHRKSNLEQRAPSS